MKANITTTKLATVLLLTAIFLIIIGILTTIYTLTTSTATTEACKQSILAHTRTKQLTANIFASQIKCPIQYTTLTETNEDKLKQQLAQKMYTCWDKYLKGEPDLFQQEGIFCAICEHITLDTETPTHNLINYLSTEKNPATGNTYLYDLSKEQLTKEKLDAMTIPTVTDSTIDPEITNTYATVFYYVKGQEYYEKLANQATGAAVGASGVAAGAVIIIYVATGPVGWIAGAATALTGIAIGVYNNVYGGTIYTYSSISLQPYDADLFKSLGCQIIPSEEKARVN